MTANSAKSIPAERLAVTVFEGDESVPVDLEAEQIWRIKGVIGSETME